jgi:hypothetical protein
MKRKILLASLLISLIGFSSLAQVSIAPTTVFIDQNGIGSLFITNSSNSPQEVDISFLFGYPGNDELGNMTMIYADSIREIQNGLGDRARSFPRSFILAPQQQQTVRIQVRPERGLAPGTYFTRIKVTSNAQTADVEQTAQTGVSTQVNFKFEQVIAAFQKIGQVNTGLEINEFSSEKNDKTLRIVHDFQTSGNSPFLGSVIATLKNSEKQVIAEHQQTVAMYYSGKKAIELNLPEGLAPGNYEVELSYETKRADIPSGDLVQAPTLKKAFPITIN